ncbi:MAG: hypothetical protein R3Y54_12475 [Eubacteriales bacterium]
MNEIISDLRIAQETVAGLENIKLTMYRHGSIRRSNIDSMKRGMEVNTEIFSNLNNVVASIKTQANKFPEIAKIMAAQDETIGLKILQSGGRLQ